MIFYFSGTGNTLWAARKVAEAIGDRLVDIAAEMRRDVAGGSLSYDVADGERIGFFYPVHGWRPPKLVREFIGKLKVNGASGSYCYVVCTAGDNIGEAETIFEHDLAVAGLRVVSAISLIMPESYVGLPFMDVDNDKNERRKKSVADSRLSAFINDIEQRKPGVRDLTIGRWPRINSRLLGSVFLNKLITDRPFKVDADKCIGCGKCEAVCPVGDIVIGEDRHPHWNHNGHCLTCFACYHHCPARAIDFGHRTKGKGQYYYERNIGK